MTAKDWLIVRMDGVMDPPHVPRGCIGWDTFDLKVPALVGFLCDGKVPANCFAEKGENQLVLVRFSVHSYQPLDNNVKARFFLRLTDGCFGGKLTTLSASAREIPHIKVAPMTEKNAVVLIENDSERSN